MNDTSASLSLIAALDEKGLIGRHGQLPWRLPADLAHFRSLTLGKTILMGRRTWDSLGRALPGRNNWVLSRDPGFAPAGGRAFDSLESARLAHAGGELMVIGGAGLYRLALPLAGRLYLTRVHAVVGGDTPSDVHFPPFDASAFVEVACARHRADARHACDYSFLTLDRR